MVNYMLQKAVLVELIQQSGNAHKYRPFKGSPTGGQISKINSNGVRTTVTDNLPTATSGTGSIFGVADVAFVGETLYGLITAGGCSHGVPSVPNGIVKVNENGKWTMIANLSEWVQRNPVKNPDMGDFEPDAGWYSMINAGNNFYVVEANGGQLVKITTSGIISRVTDLSASQGHIVPTVVQYHKGDFIVGNLVTFPICTRECKYL